MYGSFALWGDVPALMPPAKAIKFNPDGTGHPPGSWFAIADSKNRGTKQGGSGAAWFDKALDERRKGANGKKCGGARFGSGNDCSLMRQHNSHSTARKAASAQIARIPFPLAEWIARCFLPLLIVLLLALPAHAQWFSTPSVAQLAGMAVVESEIAIDALQSERISHAQGMFERNRFARGNPSLYFAGALVAFPLTAWALPPTWRDVLIVGIGIGEGVTDCGNYGKTYRRGKGGMATIKLGF